MNDEIKVDKVKLAKALAEIDRETFAMPDDKNVTINVEQIDPGRQKKPKGSPVGREFA